MRSDNVIYLDYSATTPCDKVVLEEMLPYFTKTFGNPNSPHIFGTMSMDAVNLARKRVCEGINCDFEEVIFTSGATESISIALNRVVESLSKTGRNKFITIPTEHKATITVANKLKAHNTDVMFLSVGSDGTFDLDTLDNNLNEKVGIFSICFVNNETGVIQDIKKIANICHKHGALLHVDATQALGKLHIDVKDLGIDLMSASGHKIYGPKGVGILFFKRSLMKHLRIPRANYAVEFGIRAGTIPVPLCVGFGKAVEISKSMIDKDWDHALRLRKIFVDGIQSQLSEIYIHGSKESYYPGIIDISFRGCEGEALMMEAKRIAVSSGSACTSNSLSISHVLAAMGISPDIAQSSLRITIGRYTTEEEIEIAVKELVRATNKLRAMSPVWDMIKAGINVDSVFKNRSLRG